MLYEVITMVMCNVLSLGTGAIWLALTHFNTIFQPKATAGEGQTFGVSGVVVLPIRW